MAKTFNLQVISINGIFYDGRARMIILPSIDGEYGILAEHEECIVALDNGVIQIVDENEESILAINGKGYAQMANNRMVVMVDTAEKPDTIDIERAKEAARDAQDRIRKLHTKVETDEAKASLARALNRLKNV